MMAVMGMSSNTGVRGGAIDVVSEGHWKRIAPREFVPA
jgi:hypothetical protein